MITLANVRDFMKTLNLFDGYYIGRIDNAKKNIIGVYNLNAGLRNKAIGNASKCEVAPVSLLIHGNTNKDSTEKLANSLYNALDSLKDGEIAGHKICYADLQQDRPIDVDVSDNKIYEYVVEVIFYIEKEE